mmetsp:Transcript_28446/g.92909  ORF Transcript_28446/g.92909 Transcript_28446/m.92909 type:complete len:283 (-) Transcript_28446:2051-2899(-)
MEHTAAAAEVLCCDPLPASASDAGGGVGALRACVGGPSCARPCSDRLTEASTRASTARERRASFGTSVSSTAEHRSPSMSIAAATSSAPSSTSASGPSSASACACGLALGAHAAARAAASATVLVVAAPPPSATAAAVAGSGARGGSPGSGGGVAGEREGWRPSAAAGCCSAASTWVSPVDEPTDGRLATFRSDSSSPSYARILRKMDRATMPLFWSTPAVTASALRSPVHMRFTGSTSRQFPRVCSGWITSSIAKSRSSRRSLPRRKLWSGCAAATAGTAS